MTEDTEAPETPETESETLAAEAPESNDLPPMSGEIEVEGPQPDQPVWSEAVALGRLALGTVNLREPMNHVALAEVQRDNPSALGLLALNARLNIAGSVIGTLEAAIVEMRKRIEELEEEVYEYEEEPEPAPPRPKRKRKKKNGRRR
jgi:hypothetical protein